MKQERSTNRAWLTFWGGSSILLDDGSAIEICRRYPRSAVMLAYLVATSGQSHSRRELAQMLWPHLTSDAGLSNLRQWLHALKHELQLVFPDSVLSVTRDRVQWLGRRGLIVDWDESALANWCSSGDAPAAQGLSRLRQEWLPEWQRASELGHLGVEMQAALSTAQARLFKTTAAPPELQSSHAQDGIDSGHGWNFQASIADFKRQYCVVIAILSRQPSVSGLAHSLARWRSQFASDFVTSEMHGNALVLALRGRPYIHRDAMRCLLALEHSNAIGDVSVGLSGDWIEQEALGRVAHWAVTLAQHAGPRTWIADEEWAAVACSGQWSSVAPQWSAAQNRLVPLWISGLHVRQSWLSRYLAGQRLDIPWVGRYALLGSARNWLREALATAGVKVAVWTGEHGIGKTRLMWEVLGPRATDVIWLVGREDGQRTPRLALRDWFDAVMEGPGSLQERIECLCYEREIQWSLDQRRALCTLLDESTMTEGEVAALVEALRLLMSQSSSRAIIAIDDAQWLDGATWSILQRLVFSPHIAPLVLCTWATAPPEQWPWQRWGVDTKVWHVDPLPDDEAKTLLQVAQRLDTSKAHSDTSVVIARGFPVYLVGSNASEWSGGIIQRRLAAMGHAGSVLQAAAVGGMHIQQDALAQWFDSATIHDALQTAARLSLTVTLGPGQYGFFHHLARHWVLQTLSHAEQCSWAQRWAHIYEAQQQWMDAARLWSMSGRSSEFLNARRRAAVHAAECGDMEAVLQALDDLVDEANIQTFSLTCSAEDRLLLARARVAVYGYGDLRVAEVIEPLVDSCAGTGSPELRFAVDFFQYLGAGAPDVVQGLVFADRLRRQAFQAAHPGWLLVAEFAWCNTSFWMGDLSVLPRLIQLVETARTVPATQRLQLMPSDLGAFAAALLAWGKALCADVETAQRWFDIGQTLAQQSGTAQDHCVLAAFDAFIHIDIDSMRMQSSAARGLALARESSYRLWAAIAHLQLQVARSQQGLPVDWVSLPKAVEDVCMGYPAGHNTALWLCARAYSAAGRWSDALRCTQDALFTAQRREHQLMAPDLWRIHAFALHNLRLSALEATDAAQRALELAQARGMYAWCEHHAPALHPLVHTD